MICQLTLKLYNREHSKSTFAQGVGERGLIEQGTKTNKGMVGIHDYFERLLGKKDKQNTK